MSLVERNIAIYAPHTALDSVVGGINDWILQAFQLGSGLQASPITTRKQDAQYPGAGSGRIVKLPQPISLEHAVGAVKEHFQLKHVRVALPVASLPDTRFDEKTLPPAAATFEVTSAACCAGSGGDVLRDVDASLMITGEMSHHDVLAHNHAGRAVVLTDHSNCERGYLPTLKEKLKSALEEEGCSNGIELLITKVDSDPLVVW